MNPRDDREKDGAAKLMVNINSASGEELQKLDGIGEKLAQRIIDYREENGPFRSIQDITNVSGIGSGVYDKIREHITVS